MQTYFTKWRLLWRRLHKREAIRKGQIPICYWSKLWRRLAQQSQTGKRCGTRHWWLDLHGRIHKRQTWRWRQINIFWWLRVCGKLCGRLTRWHWDSCWCIISKIYRRVETGEKARPWEIRWQGQKRVRWRFCRRLNARPRYFHHVNFDFLWIILKVFKNKKSNAKQERWKKNRRKVDSREARRRNWEKND